MKKTLTYGLYYGKWKVNGFILEPDTEQIKTKPNVQEKRKA